MSRKTFKYRLYPHRQQRERLQTTLDVCRELYNAALQERRDGYQIAKAKLNYFSQANQLGEIKAIRPDVASLHLQVLQDVLRRYESLGEQGRRRYDALIGEGRKRAILIPAAILATPRRAKF